MKRLKTTLAGLALAAALGADSRSAAAQPPAACPVRIEFEPACASRGRAGTPFSPGTNCRMVEVDGFPREYIVYVPTGADAARRRPWPVVFMHHGSGGTGEKFLAISGWTEKAEEVGLVAVYPTALPAFVLDEQRCSTKWHSYGLGRQVELTVRPRLFGPQGQPVLDYPPDAPWPADDVAFVEAMLDDVAGLGIDPARVYVSGFSNGAGFTARVAIELAHRFAAAGWVGGGLRSPERGGEPVPVPSRAIPVSTVLGACDEKRGASYGFFFDGEACARGEVDGIPLDPAALLGTPAILDDIEFLLDVFGLIFDPHSTAVTPHSTVLGWRQPVGEASGGLRVTVLDRVTHEYPACNFRRCNNPFRFSAADDFWRFFSLAPSEP